MQAPLPPDEKERLEALQRYEILDTGPEQEFDDITLLASHICGTPIALITLVDEKRQWFKSRIGISLNETSRDIAFCTHGILQPDLFVVEDTLADKRFAGNPLVTGDPKIRFYAGSPLVTPDGHALGMLCVTDVVPRELSVEQKVALQALGRQVVGQLEMRRAVAELQRTERALRESARIAALEVQVRTALTRGGSLEETLGLCCGALVQHLEAAFARIWILNEAEKMLELVASAGMYTHLNGPHGRVPVGSLKIGLIAEKRTPHLTNQVVGDPLVGDQDWAKREGMVAFAGFPLIVGDRLLGVVALFARHTLPDTLLKALESISTSIAQGIYRTQAEKELTWKTAFFEAKVNSSIDGIIVVNGKGKKILQNEKINELFRIPREIVEDTDDARQVQWVTAMTSNPDEFAMKVAYLYSHPEEISLDEIELKDGTILERNSAPVIGKDGTYYGRIWAFRNITGRKLDEEALRENEERFTGAFEHAPIGVALVSPEGRWMKVNRSLCKMLGYSEADLLDHSFQDVTHPEDLKSCLESVRQVISGELQTCQSEKRYIHRDGHFVQVSFNLSLVRDEKGKPRYLIAQIQDITERKRVEFALKESELRYRSLFGNMTEGYAYCQLLFEGEKAVDFIYLEVNNSFEPQSGLKDVVGKKISEIMPGIQQSNPELFEVYGRVVRTGKPERYETYVKSLGIWFSIWVYSQNRESFIAVFDNITERKLAEEALLESKRFAESIAENSTSVIYVFDLETNRAIYSNRNAGESLGYSRMQIDQMGDALLPTIIHPEDFPRIRESLARFGKVADGEIIDLEYRVRHANGSIRWMWSRESVFKRRPDGAVWQIMGTAQDITERKRTEESLRLLESAVEQSKESIVITNAELDAPGPRILFVNSAYSMMTGYDAQESLGKNPRILQGPKTDRAVLSRLRKNLESGEVFQGEAINYRKDGTEFILDWQITPIRDNSGKITHFVAIQRDVTERRKIEEALHRQQAELRVLFDLMPVMIWFKDTEDRILRVNQTAAQTTERSVEEIEGRMAVEIYPSYAARFYQGDLEVIRSGKPKLGLIETVRNRQGEELWIQTDRVPVCNKDGIVVGVVVMVQDITLRKSAEDELVESQQRLSLATESAQVGIWDWDVVTGHMTWDSKMFELYGIKEPYPAGSYGNWQKGLHPDDLVRAEREITAALAGDKDFHTEFRVVWPNGEPHHIEAHAIVRRSGDGTPTRMIGVNWDITVRKKAEEDLSESREKLRGILDTIPQRVFWKDLNSVYLGCNQALANDLGFSCPEEVVGKTDFETNSEALAELYRANDQGVIHSDAANLDVEEPGMAADGSPLWLRTSKVPLHDREGRVTGVLGTYEDVTESKLAKLEIQKLEAHLVQSQKLETVGKLAGGIAHEFNSILTAIIGQSEVLLKDLPSNSPLIKSASEISKAAGRAAILTGQLLAYGRKQLLQPIVLDLNGVLARMEDMFHHIMGAGVEIQIIPAIGLKAVKADLGQIEQVILNMAINAHDAMPNGGKLTLETANISILEGQGGGVAELKAGDYIVLALTDTGTGMTAEVKDRVFEPFFTTKGVGEGTGLGLSTCYGIIKQSGGHISVSSEQGRGATFKIYLPMVENGAEIPVRSFSSPSLPLGTETILLVEDDPALREMATDLLRRLGYTVLPASNGSEALSIKQERHVGHIDLLFTDLVMPHTSGKELADSLRQAFSHTRILFTSAYTAASVPVLNRGVALLQKPFTPSALAKKIREVLDSPDLLNPEP